MSPILANELQQMSSKSLKFQLPLQKYCFQYIELNAGAWYFKTMSNVISNSVEVLVRTIQIHGTFSVRSIRSVVCPIAKFVNPVVVMQSNTQSDMSSVALLIPQQSELFWSHADRNRRTISNCWTSKRTSFYMKFEVKIHSALFQTQL